MRKHAFSGRCCVCGKEQRSRNRESAEPVGAGQFHNLVAAAVQNRLDHIEVEVNDLVELERRRHGQLVAIHSHIHQRGAGMREGLLQRLPHVSGVIHVQTQDARAFGDPGEVRIHQIRRVGQEAGRLHLQFHKAQRSVVEDDDLHRQIQLPQ